MNENKKEQRGEKNVLEIEKKEKKIEKENKGLSNSEEVQEKKFNKCRKY